MKTSFYHHYLETHNLPTLDERLTVTPARSLAELDRICRDNLTSAEYNDFRLTVNWSDAQAVRTAYEAMVREIRDPFSDAALMAEFADDEPDTEDIDPRNMYAVLEH